MEILTTMPQWIGTRTHTYTHTRIFMKCVAADGQLERPDIAWGRCGGGWSAHGGNQDAALVDHLLWKRSGTGVVPCVAPALHAATQLWRFNPGPCGLMNKGLVFGAKDCRLESCQGHVLPLSRSLMRRRIQSVAKRILRHACAHACAYARWCIHALLHTCTQNMTHIQFTRSREYINTLSEVLIMTCIGAQLHYDRCVVGSRIGADRPRVVVSTATGSASSSWPQYIASSAQLAGAWGC